jgi:hypothetical protein
MAFSLREYEQRIVAAVNQGATGVERRADAFRHQHRCVVCGSWTFGGVREVFRLRWVSVCFAKHAPIARSE